MTSKIQLQRKYKILIKDLELQIDCLIGYSNQGLHWKQEYYFREELKNQFLMNEQTPQELIKKYNDIENTLYEMRQDKKNDEQPYLKMTEQIIEEKREKRIVKVNNIQRNEFYTIEL